MRSRLLQMSACVLFSSAMLAVGVWARNGRVRQVGAGQAGNAPPTRNSPHLGATSRFRLLLC